MLLVTSFWKGYSFSLPKLYLINSYGTKIDKEIPTKDLYERLSRLILLADAWIVLPGSTGTLVEFALAWELLNKQFLAERPIICLSDHWKPVYNTVLCTGETDGQNVYFAQNCSDAVNLLERFFQ